MNPLFLTFAGMAFFLICFLASSLQSSSWAQSKEPVLSLETGTHTGRITAIDVDSSGRLLVTTATDKTARV